MKIDQKALINRGHYSINFPIVVLYAAAFWVFGLDFIVLSIVTVVAWLFWSIMVPKWKLKSIKNLDSAESYVEWNSNAVFNGLIWPDNSWLAKTELWNKNDRLEYTSLRDSLLKVKA